MITAISLTERTKFTAMYRSTLRRITPVAVLYGVILVLCFPLIYILQRSVYDRADIYVHANGFAGIHNEYTMIFVVVLCAVIPIMIGTLQFSYLHNKRATDVYHALPIRRETLFSAHYLAGLTVLWAPLVLSYLLVLAAAGLYGADQNFPFLPGPILQEMLCFLVSTAAIYTITCMVAVLVGSSFDTVLFSLALCGMWPVIMWVMAAVMDMLLVGYPGVSREGILSLTSIASMSPFSAVMYRLAMQPAVRSVGGQFVKDNAFAVHQIGIIVWAILTVLILLAAIVIYRRRASERAGRPVVTSILSRIVQFATAFVGGSLCGILFGTNGFGSKPLCLLFILLGGGLAFTLLEAIFGRGFKTFPRAFVPMGIAAAIPLLVCGSVMLGGFGYVDYIPTAEEIKSVTITYDGRFGRRNLYLTEESAQALDLELSNNGMDYESYRSGKEDVVTITDPVGIEAIRKMHRVSIDDLRDTVNWTMNRAEVYANYTPTICYTLQNGKTVRRQYQNVEVQSIAELAAIEDLAEFKEQTHPAFLFTEDVLAGITLSNRLGIQTYSGLLEPADKTKLLEALRKDAMAETVETLRDESVRARGYIFLMDHVEMKNENIVLPSDPTILLTDRFTNTLAVLKELGLEQHLELDESKVNKVMIANQRFYMPSNDEWSGLYEYVQPNSRSRNYGDWDGQAYYSGWMNVNPDHIPELLAAARNTGMYRTDVWLVSFQYGDSQERLSLLLPEEALPETVREQYLEPWVEFENGTVQEDAELVESIILDW